MRKSLREIISRRQLLVRRRQLLQVLREELEEVRIEVIAFIKMIRPHYQCASHTRKLSRRKIPEASPRGIRGEGVKTPTSRVELQLAEQVSGRSRESLHL